MSVSHNITYSVQAGGRTIAGNATPVGDGEVNLDIPVANGTVDQQAAFSLKAAKAQSLFLLSKTDAIVKTNSVGTNEVQTVSLPGPPTAGTFPLSVTAGGTTQTTAGIPYNATASTVQAALAALGNVGPMNVSCAGGPLPGTPVTVTFTYDLGAQPIGVMATSSASLTGGTAAVAEATHGVAPANTFDLQAGTPYVWVNLPGYPANPLTADVTDLFITNESGASGLVQARATFNN